MPSLSPTESNAVEREYTALRPQVVAMLYAAFGTAVDPEEIYQDAWTELLEHRTAGRPVTDTRGLLRTIAWRRARDRFREQRPAPLDPTSPALVNLGDPRPLPDEAAQVHVDAGAVRQIVESLDPRQAAVIKLRFEAQLELRQIRAQLGMSVKTLDHLIARAHETIDEKLTLRADGQSEWERRQRSLLLLCLLQKASTEQQARARRMVEQDVRCRAMLAELRATLDQVAVVLPVPVLLEDHQQHGVVLLDRLNDVLTTAKTHLVSVVSRSGTRGPSGEHAAAGGTAALGAGAAKIAVGCMAAGTAAVCLAPALLPTAPTRPRTPAAEHERHPRVVERVRTSPSPAPPKRQTARTTRTQPASRSPNAPAAPSPAPAGSTEFGPGSVGSQPASRTPAAAPTTGGGEFAP